MMTIIRYLSLLCMALLSTSAFSDQVKGVIDGIANNTAIRGWACVTNRTGSIPIHIYVGGPAGKGTFLASAMASSYSETAVDSACQHAGVRGRHRFSYRFTTTQMKQHQGKKVYIHGIGKGVSNLLLTRSGVFTVPKPPIQEGVVYINGVYDNERINGWACIKGQTQSVTVQIYANGKYVRSALANGTTNAAIARECGHVGQIGRHGFNIVLTNREKDLYGGNSISAKVIGAIKTTYNPRYHTVPSELEYNFSLRTHSSTRADRITFSMDNINTKHCSTIEATAISFAGGGGAGHGLSKPHVQAVETVLGQECIRLIRADINLGTGNSGGYWLNHNNYKDASVLMAYIIREGSSNWKDIYGRPLITGKKIVIGSSAGGMIAATALDSSNLYRSLVDRTIMVASPLGVDVSYECSIIESQNLMRFLDEAFDTGSQCRQCSKPFSCINSSKDVLDITDNNFRPYLNTGHEIAILIGSADKAGCDDDNGDCGGWNAERAAMRYIQSIAAGDLYYFDRDKVSKKYTPNTLSVINGGTHDLWESSEAKRYICWNVLAEVPDTAPNVCWGL